MASAIKVFIFPWKAIATVVGLTALSGLMVTPKADPVGPTWSYGLPVYQIAIRYYNEKGGFKEIEKDLPRIKSLGVGIIYLMPVHPCSDKLDDLDAQKRCNNYQTADFMGINPVMGNLQDYKDLVKAIHAAGMYVIQDMVPRHAHPGNNMYKLHPDWIKGSSFGLPGWNYDNAAAKAYMLDVFKYWIKEVDIDGYRIDVAWSDPLNAVFTEFRPELDKLGKPIFMLAEADGVRYHPHFDMTYDWRNQRTLVIEMVQEGKPASRINENVQLDLKEYTNGALQMRHLDNHDLNVGLPPFAGTFPAKMDDRYGGGQKAFAALVATLPGKWMYYMGNEVNNPRKIPHAWGGAIDYLRWPPEASDANEYTELYTKLAHVHRDNPAVWNGEYRYLKTSDAAKLFVMERKKGSNVVLTVLNLSKSAVTGTILDDLPVGNFTEVFSGSATAPTKDISLPAWGYKIYVSGSPTPIARDRLTLEHLFKRDKNLFYGGSGLYFRSADGTQTFGLNGRGLKLQSEFLPGVLPQRKP